MSAPPAPLGSQSPVTPPSSSSPAAVRPAVPALADARARDLDRPRRAREAYERAVRSVLFVCAALAVLTTAGILASLLFEAVRFFGLVSPGEFLFGLQWSPQTALRADQVGASGAFGAVPVFAGGASPEPSAPVAPVVIRTGARVWTSSP